VSSGLQKAVPQQWSEEYRRRALCLCAIERRYRSFGSRKRRYLLEWCKDISLDEELWAPLERAMWCSAVAVA